jgi:hypothetical protein
LDYQQPEREQNMTAQCMAIAVMLVCVVWTWLHCPKETDLGNTDAQKDKLREFLVQDIRANTQNCGIYVALIGVIATIVTSSRNDFKPILTQQHLWPFGLSFLAAAVASLFFPAGYGSARYKNLRAIWLRSVICEQVVVIFTCYGIWNAFLVLTGH